MASVEKLVTQHLDLWTTAIKRKSTAGRGSSNKVEMYGIKKLRELILELAVTGKLVPQNPQDEPASELLKKIAAEKAKLLKEGKIKKDKPLPPISDQDLQIVLPNGWSLARLGTFVSIVRGITFPASEKNSEPGPGLVACLRTANVQTEIDWKDLLYIDESFIRRDDQFLQTGDIVMSMANSRDLVGKVSYTDLIPVERATFGGFLGVIRPYQLSANYLMCVLRAPHTRMSLIDSASQTTNIANISLEKLNPLVIALPPLAEQNRIVAKVDELMALCDQLELQTDASLGAHQILVATLLNALTTAADQVQFASSWQRLVENFDTLFTTEESIDQLKQTLLQLAVMGKLVPQDPNDEPASELLKKIAAKKGKLAEEGKIKAAKPMTPIAPDEAPFVIPIGWSLARLSDVMNVLNGRAYKKQEMLSEGTPILRVGNLFTSNEWYFSDLKLEPDKYIDNGDLIYAWSASFGPFIWQGGKVIYHYHIWKMDFFSKIDTDKYYFRHYLQAISAAIKESGNGIAMIHMTKERMEKLVLPIPPLAEQHRIVAKFAELTLLCDQLKARIADEKNTQVHLADVLAGRTLTEA